MNAFLGTLVARGRGRPAGLAPRVPALFEPAPGPALFGALPEQPMSEPPAAVTPPRPVAVPAGPGEVAPPAPAAVPPPGDASLRPHPSPVVQAEGREVEARREHARPGPSAAMRVASPTQDRAAPRPGPGATAGSRSHPAPQSRVPAAVADPVLHPVLHPATPLPAQPPPVGALTPRPVVEVVRSVDPGTARGSRGEPAPRRTDAPPAPPVVHVTIGRVEVRAVHAAAPRPAARREAPSATSLDAYLSERNRRGSS